MPDERQKLLTMGGQFCYSGDSIRESNNTGLTMRMRFDKGAFFFDSNDIFFANLRSKISSVRLFTSQAFTNEDRVVGWSLLIYSINVITQKKEILDKEQEALRGNLACLLCNGETWLKKSMIVFVSEFPLDWEKCASKDIPDGCGLGFRGSTFLPLVSFVDIR